jgi:transaldolase
VFVLPSAAALGVKMEEVYGAIAHITKAGIEKFTEDWKKTGQKI